MLNLWFVDVLEEKACYIKIDAQNDVNASLISTVWAKVDDHFTQKKKGMALSILGAPYLSYAPGCPF